MVDALQDALHYAGFYGWQVIKLYGSLEPNTCSCWRGADCPSPGKHPVEAEWQKAATDDEDKLIEWFESDPKANLGVRLGECSGIVDIECDDDQAELDLVELFGGVENIPPCPMFSSGRGKHRLFKWSSDLPEPNKVVFKIGKNKSLEVRTGNGGKGAQSVFPPSMHYSGEQYKWLLHPSECEIPEISDEVISRMHVWLEEGTKYGDSERSAKSQEHWVEIAKGVSEGSRNDTAASFIGYCLGELQDPENNTAVATQWQLIQAWNQNNSPPLDDQELRTTFESILSRHRANWSQRQNAKFFERDVDRDEVSGEVSTVEWKIVRVLSDPITYKLYSPLWQFKAPGGFILLTKEQIACPAKITIEAAAQAGKGLDAGFYTFWKGNKKTPGHYVPLIDNAPTEEPPAEQKRQCVIAGMINERVIKARHEDAPDHRGRPVVLGNGTVWFKFQAILSDLQFIAEPVKTKELSAFLQSVGAMDKQKWNEGSPIRYKVLDAKALKKVSTLAMYGSEIDKEAAHSTKRL